MQKGDRCNITKDFREYIGREYTTNEGYKITILDYIGRHEILIKFNDNPDVTIWTTLQNIKNGQIKNPYKRSVYNIGYYGVGNYTARNNNIKTEEYIKWISMFVRCYDDKYHERQPSYIGCTVAEGIDKVYACSKSPFSEIPGKRAFIKDNYGLPDDNIYFTLEKTEKLTVLQTLQQKLGLKPSQIAIVEDTVKTLDYIRAHSDFVTVHVSSFME